MTDGEEGLLGLADAIGARIAAGQLPPQDENGFYILDNPCPTCGAVGQQQCIRGRKPNGGQGISGAIWKRGIPFPEGHDSRRSANSHKSQGV